MRSGDRLNQLEPLVAEMLVKLDETAAKVDKVSEDVEQLRVAMQKSNDIASKQSDAISFLLENQLLTNNKLDQMTGRLNGMDSRLDQMDRRLDQMDSRLDQMDRRFDQIDGRLDQMDNNFDEIKRRLVNNENTQQEIKLVQESILTILKSKN